MIRSILITWLLHVLFSPTMAQKKSIKDSLFLAIRQNQLSDTSRVRVLNDLGKVYRLTFPDSAIYFSKEAHAVASRVNDVPGIATSLNFIGVGYFYKGDYPEAQKYQKQALDFAEMNNLLSQKANAHNSLALAYQYQGNYISALENYLSALKIEEDAKNYTGIVKVLANTSILFKKQGDTDNAIAYSNRALELTGHLKDARMARANISNNLGSAYMEKDDYKKALEYLLISLQLNKELQNKIFISSAMGNIGYCYFKLNDIKKAEEYLYEGLRLGRETGATEGIINILVNLADMKLANGNLNEALAYTLESFALAKRINSKAQILQNYRNMGEIYSRQGDFKKGYEFIEKAFLLHDSLKNSDINKRVNDLQNSYALHKKEGELKLLEKDALIKAVEMKGQQTLTNNLFIIVGALVVCISVVFYGFRIKSRLNQRLKKQNEIIESVNNDLRDQALRAQMNPHFIFNALNSIQFLILEKQTERSIDYLSKFASLLRQVMDNSEKSWIPLEDEINLLKLYLDLEGLRFNGAFSYEVRNDTTAGLKIPPLIVQPYVENAIRHGLLPKSGDKKLEISFSAHDHQLFCEVKDNGIGREAASAQSRRKLFSSKGMNYTAARIQMLNASGDRSNVFVEDLVEDGMPSGTRVKISIDL